MLRLYYFFNYNKKRLENLVDNDKCSNFVR